ncbi:MAG: pilus assembly protein [Rhizobiales bacterium]|nr:pilus assembly protein [Hyphomicrobiales bacterium]
MTALASVGMILTRKIRDLKRDQRGVSAVEFAMLLPLMVTLYLGGVEVSQGISADRKVSLTARTLSDLVSQYSSINNAGMTNILNASTTVISPFPSSSLKATVSLVTIDANSKATIAWSDTLNGTARSKGSTVTLPAALVVPNTSLVWSEIAYSYKPTIGYVITGTMTLKDQLYMRPRLSDTISRTAT